MEGRDKDVDKLRTEVSRQLDRYDDLWLVHDTLLEEAQKLRFEVITLRSSVRVEGVGVRLGVENQSPKGHSFGSGHQSWRSSDPAESSGSWHERAWGGLTDRGSGRRRGRWG